MAAKFVTYLHSVCEHPRQSEWDFFWELVAVHRDFKAIAEIDVDDLTRYSVEHQVRGMTIAQSQDVPNHTGHGQ